jgi:hypothetical protein
MKRRTECKGELYMKTILRVSSMASVLCLVPFSAQSQSTIEFQSGTTIEVQSGADICADNVLKNGTTSGSGTQCGGVLPVEVLALTAQVGKSAVTLNWSTATETNNFGFNAERRLLTNGRMQSTDWTTVGFVQGRGTSTSPAQYSFTDQNLSPGRYAYRIRQIDNDGSFAFTAALEVEVGLAPKEFMLSQNYPNPFNPTTTIEFTLQEDGHVVLKLYDLSGRELVTMLDEERKAGYYQLVTLDASRFGSGTYFYRLQAGGRLLTRKMLLVK